MLKPQSAAVASHDKQAAAREEDRELRRLQREVDQESKKLGMAGRVKTRVTERGLVIDILTDNLLFDSGAARIKPAGMELLGHLGPMLRHRSRTTSHVEGHTDNVADPAARCTPPTGSCPTARAWPWSAP